MIKLNNLSVWLAEVVVILVVGCACMIGKQPTHSKHASCPSLVESFKDFAVIDSPSQSSALNIGTIGTNDEPSKHTSD